MTPSSTLSIDTKAWLTSWLANELAVAPSTIDSGQTFLNFGLNSVQAMTMVGDLEAKLGLRLSPTLAWDYPSIDTLAAFLDQQIVQEQNTKPASARLSTAHALAAVDDVEGLLAELDTLSDQDVDSLLDQYLGESK